MVQLRQTQLLQEKTVKDIAQEVKDAYLALKDAIAKIKAVASEIKVYADNLKVTRRRYQKGMSSLLDSSDAALKYAVSRFKRSQAIYDYLIAKFSFGQATGGM
jgi:outer membrane protein TolC